MRQPRYSCLESKTRFSIGTWISIDRGNLNVEVDQPCVICACHQQVSVNACKRRGKAWGVRG